VIEVRGPGQICRNLTCKLCVCNWQSTDEPSGGRWSPRHAISEFLLDPLDPNFDLTSPHGQVVAAAKRSIINGLVRWQKNPRFRGANLIEVHYVDTVRP
jgi:hypothetical protein